jgi:hypothetical protein
MLIDQLSNTRASQIRRQRNPWPLITAIMAVIGAIGGALLAQH